MKNRVFAALVVAAASMAAAPPPLTDPRTKGAAWAQANPGDFSWLMFIYANWPELIGQRGQPDPKKTIGAPGATVWESFKSTAEVYLPNGQKPPGWNQLAELPFKPGSPAAPPMPKGVKVDSPWIHQLTEQYMIDLQQIVDPQSRIVQYDVRGNQDYFNYVVNNPSGFELFNLEGQSAALASPTFTFSFPAGALEVKASWRLLGPQDDDTKFWTAYGYYVDSQKNRRIAKIGLTGLHIISKITPQWFWMTFEQVNDPTATFQYLFGKKGQAVGVNQTFNPTVAAFNAKYQAMLAGTKWANYQLIGWQTAFMNGSQPSILANTQIETYFQKTSSCITCHGLASIGPSSQLRLNLWNAQGQAYTGTIAFQTVAKQQFPSLTFKSMDYVWSLRNAFHKSGMGN